MKKSVKIYGIEYRLPNHPPIRTVVNFYKKKSDQYFERTEIPDIFSSVEMDEDGEPIWSDEQQEFIIKEHKKCTKDGHWFLNNGELTYITPLHYFYLQYWTLEDGTIPEYRDVDRRWFYFFDYCCSINSIDGIIRLKKRREGATSQVCCWLLWMAIFFKQSNCGIVSKTGKDASTAFEDMVIKGWKSLPLFFQPRYDASDDPKKYIKFVKPPSKKKSVIKLNNRNIWGEREGMNSIISWRNTALNSFDSGRITALLIDEGAKFPKEVPINRYLSIVKETLHQGINRVGFLVIPSTMNALKDGGKEYKLIWDDSNHFDNKITGSGLYRYFVPAYDGLPGFIDKYGQSIIDEATKEQKEFLLEKYGKDAENMFCGAKKYLLYKRSIAKDPESLAELIRMYPFSEEEALRDDQRLSHFNLNNLYDQLQRIGERNPYIRKVKFYIKEDGDVDWRDENWDERIGGWSILEFPNNNEINKFSEINGFKTPLFAHKYKLGADPYRNTIISGKGSMGTIVIFSNLDMGDPENTGMPIAVYRGRPRLKSMFYKEIYMATRYYSCRACIESDIDDFIEHFSNWKALGFLRKTPRCMMAPGKKKENVFYGVKSADPFALNKELELAQQYVMNHCHKIWFRNIIEDMIEYDHSDRTKSDLTVAVMMALADMAGDFTSQKKEESPPKKFIETYELKLNIN